MSELPIPIEFAIGSATGLLDCVLFHWIDTLKVRRQDGRPLLMDISTRKPLNLSNVGMPRAALASICSLYAGFSTNLSLKVPYMASMFAFNALNNRLLAALGAGDSATKELASAALVGVEVSLLLSPLEMVRIQGQNNGLGGLGSATRAVAATASGLGYTGMWQAWTRGMTATMQRECKYCAGQFFLCAKIAEYVSARLQPPPDAADRGMEARGAPRNKEALSSQIAGAVLGGVACTVVSHPDDVIKTRMQTHLRGSKLFSTYDGFVSSGLHVIRTEGVSALFRGAVFRCLLRVPLGLSVIIVSGTRMREEARRRYNCDADR